MGGGAEEITSSSGNFINTVTLLGHQLGLDGVDDVAVQAANVPSPSPLDLTTFTIEAWIFPTVIFTGTSIMVIVADSAYDLSVVNGSPQFACPNEPRIRFRIFIDTFFFSLTSISCNVFKVNQWNHIVGIVDSTGEKLRLGINGNITTPDILFGTLNTSRVQKFSVGNFESPAIGSGPFKGRVDEVRLSSKVRYTGTFIPAPVFSPDANTVGLWHFDETAGSTTFDDSSGNGHHLIGLNGATTVVGTR